MKVLLLLLLLGVIWRGAVVADPPVLADGQVMVMEEEEQDGPCDQHGPCDADRHLKCGPFSTPSLPRDAMVWTVSCTAVLPAWSRQPLWPSRITCTLHTPCPVSPLHISQLQWLGQYHRFIPQGIPKQLSTYREVVLLIECHRFTRKPELLQSFYRVKLNLFKYDLLCCWRIWVTWNS